MNRNTIAVSVGYNFGLIPAEALTGIELMPTESAVRFQDQNWNLFKAKTYEDSRKIDVLLDKYGEHPILKHRIEPVRMSGELEIEFPGFDKERDSLLFGGYTFVCDGKDIPFDFSGTAWDIQQNGDLITIPFYTGKTPLSTDYFLDDCYEEEYAAAGFHLNEISASFLASATSISEFMVSLEQNGKEYGPEDIARMGRFTLKSLTFSNLKKEYPIQPEVLAAYNHSLPNDVLRTNQAHVEAAPSEKAIWITVYKSALAHPSDHDNLTEICIPESWLEDTLHAQGHSLNSWLDEYTADDTEEIARMALDNGILLDCSDPSIKKALLSDTTSLNHKMQDAQRRTSEGISKDNSSDEPIRSDPPAR